MSFLAYESGLGGAEFLPEPFPAAALGRARLALEIVMSRCKNEGPAPFGTRPSCGRCGKDAPR